MQRKLSRREFVAAGAMAGVAAALPGRLQGVQSAAPGAAASPAPLGAPAVIVPPPVKPLVVSAANGMRSRDAQGKTCVERAYEMITSGGDVLDAVIAGVNIVELDPKDTSVGYGGLPNADGVVQLDSCCMHGPLKRAGGVAAIEGVKTPSLVARAVMDNTDNHLLVGAGAQAFARNMGFEILDDLNTPESRKAWLEWKRRTDAEHYLDPRSRALGGQRIGMEMVREGWIPADHYWGTINCDGINAKGDICAVTTTSGLAFKIPGRTGDSPILGAGLYLDNDLGAAGSTGRGEANLYNLSSYQIVENMRRGMSPKDAGLDVLKRIVANNVEKRLQNAKGNPNWYLNFYILSKKGEYAGVSLYPSKFAVCDEKGSRLEDSVALFEGSATD